VSVESRRLKEATAILQAYENQVERAGQLCAGSSLISDGDDVGVGAPLGACMGPGPSTPLIFRCEQSAPKNLLEGLGSKTRRRHGLFCSYHALVKNQDLLPCRTFVLSS